MSNSSPLIFKPRRMSSPRNAFDISHHSYFTSPTGLIQPCYVQDVIPGDFTKLEVTNFTRTVPVNSAAFARLTEHVDFFFVPYRLLWRNFDSVVTGVDDINTNLHADATGAYQGSTGDNSVPYITGEDIHSLLTSDELDIHGYPVKHIFYRALDQLGYPVRENIKETAALYAASSPTNKNKLNLAHYNALRIYAYCRVLFDFYRITEYDRNIPDAYNFDATAQGKHIDSFNKISQLLISSYKPWAKDRLTSIKPSQLAPSPVPHDTSDNLGDLFVYNGQRVSIPTKENNTSPEEIRAAFAMDKLGRLSMLAPKTYRDQLSAHFGVKPGYTQYLTSNYLGSFDSNILIGDVVATANGSDGLTTNVLGQIAGKGISQGHTNQPIQFTASEHGIIIGLHYVQPQSEYDSNILDDFNRKFSRSDYYVPEFDSLGLQPLTVSSVCCGKTDPNYVLGYQSRYLEYKTAVDKCHGQFQSHGPLRHWSISRTPDVDVEPITLHRGPKGFTITPLSIKRLLRISPSVSNSIFPLVYNGDILTDDFLCHFRFDVVKVSNMSINGIPSL